MDAMAHGLALPGWPALPPLSARNTGLNAAPWEVLGRWHARSQSMQGTLLQPQGKLLRSIVALSSRPAPYRGIYRHVRVAAACCACVAP